MILDIIKTVLKTAAPLIGGSFGEKAQEVADGLSGEIAKNPEIEKLLVEKEVELKKIVAADAAGARELIIAEGKSEDAFVRRARPAFLWLFYGVIAFNFVLFPMFKAADVLSTITYPDLPQELYYLFGTSFLGYSGFRTFDKFKKNGNGKK